MSEPRRVIVPEDPHARALANRRGVIAMVGSFALFLVNDALVKLAGELRLAHRDASLDELGHHAEPPMTKDPVAGRIRRLLAMADKRAQQEGIPGTEAAVPVGLDV